jgi:hypothetical protein
MARVLTQQFTHPRISRSHSGGLNTRTTSECHLWRRPRANTEPARHFKPRNMSPKSHNLPQNDGTAMKFVVGQRVQAQYRVGSTWRSAIVSSVQPSFLTLQFDGWKDVNYIPIERVRHVREEDHTSKPTLKAFVSRGSAVLSISPKSRRYQKKTTSKPTSKPTTSKPMMANVPVNTEAIKQLQVLKQTAVINEDFLTAATLKMQIDKVTALEREKVAAVNKEDFLLAIDLKKQIDELVQPIHDQPTQCK